MLASALGSAGFGPLNAYCMMTFSLLYIPCIATLATVKRESGSTKWMLGTALFQLAVAWIITFIIYQAGRLLGTVKIRPEEQTGIKREERPK